MNGFSLAFARLHVATELAPVCHKSLAGQCFQGHERFDLLWRGRKIAGAAQRRTRQGLLIQGSVQPAELGVGRTDWERAMCDAARAERAADWTDFEVDPQLADRARQLASEKYSQSRFNQKR